MSDRLAKETAEFIRDKHPRGHEALTLHYIGLYRQSGRHHMIDLLLKQLEILNLETLVASVRAKIQQTEVTQ